MKKLAMLLPAVFAVVTFALPASIAEARMCFRCDGKGYIETYEYDSKTVRASPATPNGRLAPVAAAAVIRTDAP